MEGTSIGDTGSPPHRLEHPSNAKVAPEESAKKAWADAKKADAEPCAEHAGDGYLATCAKEWAKVKPEVKLCAVCVLVYIAVGITFYTQYENWTAIDGFYFCVTTLTTVGYGDLLPQTDVSKMFTSFFVLVGIGLIAAALGIVMEKIMDYQEQLAKELMGDTNVDPSSISVPVQTMMKSCAIMLFFIGVGTGFYSWVEDMTFVNALYMSVITVTTVGFGDESPQTQWGRMFGSVWILFGVAAVAKALAPFVKIFLDKRGHARHKEAMSEFEKHAGEDGKLDINEFLLMELQKLQDMGKITADDLDKARQKFKAMDKDGTNMIEQSEFS